MAISFDIKKTINVNGKEYASLEEVPAELRAAIEDAVASGAPTTTIKINGKTVASADELPAPLRAIVRGLVDMAMKKRDLAAASPSDAPSPPRPGALRPEPILGIKAILVVIGLAAMVFWLVRSAH